MIGLIISICINIFFVVFVIIIAYMMRGVLGDGAYMNKSTMLNLFDISAEDIVFLGDSITEGCNWSELFQNPHIKNRGIGGDSSKGVLDRLDGIIEGKPKKVFLCIGTNDFGRRIGPGKTVENIKEIILTIKKQSGKTDIFLQSLFPVRGLFAANLATNGRIRKINQDLLDLAKELGITFIDLHDHFLDQKGELDKKYSYEGLHLNGNGYMKWKQLIQQHVV